jgi:predicted Zn-dependent protease with MMP-like domain
MVNLTEPRYDLSVQRDQSSEGPSVANAKDWVTKAAPTLAEIEALATDAWDRLPGEFRELCRDIVFRVEDFATDEILDEMGIEDAFDLMGLYKGVSLDRKSVLDQSTEPDMVFLYRRPILDYWSEGDETLGHLVAHVLIHEIGHHFGLSDADMEAIENEASHG